MFSAFLAFAVALAFTPLAGSPDQPQLGMTDNSISCAVPDVPATVSYAAIPEAPFVAQLQHAVGTTSVQIDIDATGAILETSVLQSSGDTLLDRAALSATNLSHFRPEIKDCAPVGGSYLYQVEFLDN
jgi:TonB family protein